MVKTLSRFREIDATGDGNTDFYEWDPFAEDSNLRGVGFTALTDAQICEPYQFPVQGQCQQPTK